MCWSLAFRKQGLFLAFPPCWEDSVQKTLLEGGPDDDLITTPGMPSSPGALLGLMRFAASPTSSSMTHG